MNQLKDLMALSHVPRWGIVDTRKKQNVAEHAFNVAVIVMELAKMIGFDEGATNRAVRWAILHDGPEAHTGDIPTPTKRHLGAALDEVENHLCPWYKDERKLVKGTGSEQLVKTADICDGLIFLERHAYGNVGHIKEQLWDRLHAVTHDGPLLDAAKKLIAALA